MLLFIRKAFRDLCTKYEPINFVRRASYHFKASEFRSLRVFDFYQFLTKNNFKRTLKIHFSAIDVKTLIALLV
mgnify:CR=1 FL=1